MAASFSGTAKSEICKIFPQKPCCALAEFFGVLLFCGTFNPNGIRIVTENSDFSQLLPKLLKKAFSIQFDTMPEQETSTKSIFQIQDPYKLAMIMDAYGFSMDHTLALHVNLPVVENECCRAAFLRGAFLAGGSVTDPEKGYHLEFATTHAGVSRQTNSLIYEAMGILPKSAVRGGSHVLYVKQSDVISDLLTYLGAPLAAMGIMEAKLEKEINNKVNRRCNCDEANTSKVVEAAQEQLAAIRILRENGKLQSLPNKLLQAATVREENPSASLTELASMVEPPISKPAMNHRLKKLVAAAKELSL